MADTAGKPRRRRSLGGWKLIVAIVLILAYLAGATYGVMSDASARGLTVKMFSASRYCTTTGSLETLNYNVRGSVWSTSSIQTSLSHLSFSLFVDGSALGTSSQGDSSFGPGQGVPFNLTFVHPSLDPTGLVSSSKLVLTLSSTVAAGLYSGTEASSDSLIQTFTSPGC